MDNGLNFEDHVWRFYLADKEIKTGQVSQSETLWSPYGVPAVLAIQIGAITKPIYIPWHSVVYYEKL